MNCPKPTRPDPDRPAALTDPHGRPHTNLRVSVTDRCNLRCTYCMPEDARFMDRREWLTFAEVAAFVRLAAVPLGIDKLRLTGGEPLLRPGLPGLVAELAGIDGVADLALTTNGLLLAGAADELRAAGLRRVNVSLDTLDAGRFRAIARRDGLGRVLDGLAAAKAAGFDSVKVNAVSVRGFTDIDAVPLARYCREHGFGLRFIESMPIGAGDWSRADVFTAEEILRTLGAEFGPLKPAAGTDPHAPSADYDYADGGGRVGVIASVTRPFCGSCNRLRLTADGKLRNCLFALDEIDARPPLRADPIDADALRQCVRDSVARKWAGHRFNDADYRKPGRTMHLIGG